MVSETWADTVVKTNFFRTKEMIQLGTKGVNQGKNVRSTRWCKPYVSRLQLDGEFRELSGQPDIT